jgi:hypothetical protein
MKPTRGHVRLLFVFSIPVYTNPRRRVARKYFSIATLAQCASGPGITQGPR